MNIHHTFLPSGYWGIERKSDNLLNEKWKNENEEEFNTWALNLFVTGTGFIGSHKNPPTISEFSSTPWIETSTLSPASATSTGSESFSIAEKEDEVFKKSEVKWEIIGWKKWFYKPLIVACSKDGMTTTLSPTPIIPASIFPPMHCPSCPVDLYTSLTANLNGADLFHSEGTKVSG